jgi:hypothetical protein
MTERERTGEREQERENMTERERENMVRPGDVDRITRITSIGHICTRINTTRGGVSLRSVHYTE